MLSSVVFVLAHPRDNCSDPHRSLPSSGGRSVYPTRRRIERTLVLSLAERKRRERSSRNAAHDDSLRNPFVAKSDELTPIESHSYTRPPGGGVRGSTPREDRVPSAPPRFPTFLHFYTLTLLNSVSASESTLPQTHESVSKQRTLTPLESALPKKVGGGRWSLKTERRPLLYSCTFTFSYPSTLVLCPLPFAFSHSAANNTLSSGPLPLREVTDHA
jgi:hypothetical protein